MIDVQFVTQEEKKEPLKRSGVFVDNGQVVVKFNQPVDGIVLSPDEARMMALSLRQCANQIERMPKG